MTTCYKLTNNVHKTQNNTSWGKNITHKLPEKKKYTICSGDVLHAYPSPELAALMDVIYSGYLPHGILWECIGEEVVADGTKIGCRVLTTLAQIPIPSYTTNQRIAFGILCAQYVYKDPDWNAWAKKWLSGEDRSKESAYSTSHITSAAALAADYAAPNTCAARAANETARAAYATLTSDTIYAAAHAAAHAAESIINNDYSFIDSAAKTVLNETY